MGEKEEKKKDRELNEERLRAESAGESGEPKGHNPAPGAPVLPGTPTPPGGAGPSGMPGAPVLPGQQGMPGTPGVPGEQQSRGQIPGRQPGNGYYGYQNPYQSNWQNQQYYGNDYSRKGAYNNYPNQNYGNLSQGNPYGRQGGYQQGDYTSGGSAGNGGGEKKPRSGKKALAAIGITALLALCAGVVCFAVYMWGGREQEEAQRTSAEPENPQISQVELVDPKETESAGAAAGSSLPGNLTDVSELVEKIMPSVVSVKAVYSYNGGYWNDGYKEKYDGGGSGFIIGENETEVLIATNSHVVADTEELEVSFVDETSADAMVKGYDNDLDVAVIAVRLEDISEETRKTIMVAKLGDSSTLKAGQAVISIGNALLLGQSVTTGIISAVDMPVGGGYDEMGNQYGSDDRVMIQTTAIMNPGCSGGVLVNASGEVVGINTMTISAVDVEGMCYAIPITNAIPVLDKLKAREIRERLREEESGYLGISCSNVEGREAEEFEIPKGVYVRDAYEGEAADEAGVRKGDVIVALNEVPVETLDELSEMLRYYPVGEVVDLEIMRYESGEYRSQVISVRLGKR